MSAKRPKSPAEIKDEGARLEVEAWPVGRPIPYARNARKIGEAAVAKVAASIKEFGFRQPIVVDAAGVIIVGHARLLAAQRLGLTEVPVHVARNLTPAQVKAYRLMDNRSHEEAEWDYDLLGTELLDLQGIGMDLGLTGFDTDEISELLIKDNGSNDRDDDVPELPAEPVTRAGDLWLLGNHRVLCGDSTNGEHVGALMKGEKADMVFTDPPYGVNFGVANHNPRAKRWKQIANDDKNGEHFATFLLACFANLIAYSRAATPVYCWSASMLAGYQMLKALMDAGLHIQSQIIWVKNCIVLGQADYQWRHEVCWYGWTAGKGHYWNGGRALSTIWDHSKDGNSS